MTNVLDWIGYHSVSILARFFRRLPLPAALGIGRFTGRLFFYFSNRRRVAYADIKAAFGNRFDEKQRWHLVRRHYENYGQMFVEILRFPLLSREEIDRTIKIHDLEKYTKLVQEGRGGVLLTAHFGNWELLQIVSGIFGKPVHVLARGQKFNRLNELLNAMRQSHGSVSITRGMGLRGLMRSLRRKELVGILGDQDAGRDQGKIVRFLGRKTTVPTGAFELANRAGVPVLPCFIVRREGAFHEIFIEEQIDPQPKHTAEIQGQVESYVRSLEKLIREYPEEWLWESKRWKYTWTKRILILSDGKTGHLKQTLAVAGQFSTIQSQYGRPGMEYPSQTLEVRFRSPWHKRWFQVFSIFFIPWAQGRLRYLRFFFTPETQNRLENASADFILSAGSGLVPLNRILARDSRAKSIVLMKPSFPYNLFRYDLAVVPYHDGGLIPAHAFRTLLTPNSMESGELESAAEKIGGTLPDRASVRFAVFLGGSTHRFRMPLDQIEKLFTSVDKLAKEYGDYLVTTSRRTDAGIESFLRQNIKQKKECQMLVIGRQDTRPEVVPGMMALAETLIVTEDSLSMISEAISSGKKVIVVDFGSTGLPLKHRRFRQILEKQSSLAVCKPDQLEEACRRLESFSPQAVAEMENRAIREKIEAIL